jgi:hypothetical protein
MADVAKDRLAYGRCDFYDQDGRTLQRSIPVIPIGELQALVIICVKQHMTNGDMEAYLAQLIDKHKWIENRDFVHFG